MLGKHQGDASCGRVSYLSTVEMLQLNFEELLGVGQAVKYGLHSCRENSGQKPWKGKSIMNWGFCKSFMADP